MEKRDTARVACRPATLCGKFNRATVCGESCGNGFLDTGSIPVGSTIWSNNLYIFTFRGYSSAGRALEWHSRGQRFDPAYLHQNFRAPRGNSHRIFILIRACSSVGRALRSQRRGHGFESHQVHHEKGTCASECLFWLSYSAQTEKNTGFIYILSKTQHRDFSVIYERLKFCEFLR